MNIEVKTRGIDATRELRHFARCRADLALGALRDQVGLISLFVDIADAAEDDAEVRCRVLIRRSAHPDLVIEVRDANLYVAVHRSLDQAGWKLAQALMHQQSKLIHRQFDLIDHRLVKPGSGELAAAGRAA